MTPTSNNCEHCERMLDAYRDGELSPAERSTVETHLTGCQQCQSKLADIERLVQSLKAMPRLAPAVDFSSRLDELLQAPPPPNNVVAFKRPLAWATGIAAAVVLMVLALNSGILRSPVKVASNKEPAHTRPSAQDRQMVAEDKAIAPEPQGEGPARVSQPDSTVASVPIVPESSTKSTEDKSASVRPAQPPVVATRTAPEAAPAARNNAVVDERSDSQQRILASRVEHNDIEFMEMPVNENDSADNMICQESAIAVAVLAGDDNTITGSLGIATDEDGLYALKM